MDNIKIFTEKFYKDFQEYIYKNKVLVAASGFTIGMATNELIKSIIDIFNPILLSNINILLGIFPLQYKYPIIFNLLGLISNVLWLIIIWFITILLSFFVIEYLLNRKIIGLSSTLTKDKKDEYLKIKMEAKKNILPTDDDIKDIDNDNKIIENLLFIQ